MFKGYARIFLAIVSFFFMPTCPKISVFCYLLSGLLDAFDGHAARYLNQGTKFGAMLDMLTDRCATMCLCVVLAMFYPKWAILFQLSMSLDIASHWLHMHASMMNGSNSHKSIDLSGNPILRLYYTSRVRFDSRNYFILLEKLNCYSFSSQCCFLCALAMRLFMPCYIC